MFIVDFKEALINDRLMRLGYDSFMLNIKAATILLRSPPMSEELDLFNTDNTESVEIDDPFVDSKEVVGDSSSDSLQALESIELDSDELLEQEAELFLAAGDYSWSEAVVGITRRNDDSDKQLKDVLPSLGRTFIQVGGVVVNASTRRKGRFNFTMSPDTRYVRDEDGNVLDPPQHDFFTNNWAKCVVFFFQRYERKPKKVTEVIAMLQDCRYTMYVTKSKKSGANYLGNFKEIQ